MDSFTNNKPSQLDASRRSTAARVVRRLTASFAFIGAVSLGIPRADAIPCNAPCQQPTPGRISLALYWNNSQLDNASAASGTSRSELQSLGYAFVRNEAQVFREYAPGLVALRLSYHAGRGDHYTSTSTQSMIDTSAANYAFRRLEGWVYPTQQPGTVALDLYWNSTREDAFLAATAQAKSDAVGAGYTFVRTEGYGFPP